MSLREMTAQVGETPETLALRYTGSVEAFRVSNGKPEDAILKKLQRFHAAAGLEPEPKYLGSDCNFSSMSVSQTLSPEGLTKELEHVRFPLPPFCLFFSDYEIKVLRARVACSAPSRPWSRS